MIESNIDDRSLYLTGYPEGYKYEELKQHLSIIVGMQSLERIVMKEKFAILIFKLSLHAKQFLPRLNGLSVNDEDGNSFKLVVKTKTKTKSQEEKEKEAVKEERKRVIVIHNLNKKYTLKQTESNLLDHFKSYGNITNIRIPHNTKDRQYHRGYAFVHFAKGNQAEKAREMNDGRVLLDRKMKISEQKSREEVLAERAKEVENDKMKDDNDESDSDDEEEVEEESDDSDDSDSDDLDENDTKSKLQTTVFIRNCPSTTKRHDLISLFSIYGPIESCYLVKNKETGDFAGTAFLDFKSRKGYFALFKQMKAYEQFMKSTMKDDHKKERFGTCERLRIDGQSLYVARAVGKATAKRQKNRANDNRNLYLAQEGFVPKGSRAAEGISANVLKWIQSKFHEKMSQLSRNPNLHVSRNKLRFVNVPKSWDSEKVKTIFKEAAVSGSNSKKPVVITLVKFLNVKDGGTTKNLHSGRGFILFKHHKHALAALRGVNNNPHILESGRIYVEFAIENKLKVYHMKQNSRLASQKREWTGSKEFRSSKKTRKFNDQRKHDSKGDHHKRKRDSKGDHHKRKRDSKGDHHKRKRDSKSDPNKRPMKRKRFNKRKH